MSLGLELCQSLTSSQGREMQDRTEVSKQSEDFSSHCVVHSASSLLKLAFVSHVLSRKGGGLF